MDATTLQPSHSRIRLDELPAEILIHIFSFVFGSFSPRLEIGDTIQQWKVLLPSTSYFLVSKTLHSAAQRARLDCFSGTIKYTVPTIHPCREKLEQAYLRLQSRLNGYLDGRVKRHVYRMGSSNWIPSLMQGVDTRYPVVVDFVIRAIFDPFFWHCVARVPVPTILSGGADKRLETWLTRETYRLSKYYDMAGFVEYPWSQVHENVEIYLTAQSTCGVPGTKAKYPLDIVFIWRDGWHRHKFRFAADKKLSSEDVDRLVIDGGLLCSRNTIHG